MLELGAQHGEAANRDETCDRPPTGLVGAANFQKTPFPADKGVLGFFFFLFPQGPWDPTPRPALDPGIPANKKIATPYYQETGRIHRPRQRFPLVGSPANGPRKECRRVRARWEAWTNIHVEPVRWVPDAGPRNSTRGRVAIPFQGSAMVLRKKRNFSRQIPGPRALASGRPRHLQGVKKKESPGPAFLFFSKGFPTQGEPLPPSLNRPSLSEGGERGRELLPRKRQIHPTLRMGETVAPKRRYAAWGLDWGVW